MPQTFASPFHAYGQVRAVIAPTPSLIVSASRDGTVRSWKMQQKEAVNPLLAKSAPAQADTVDMSVFKQHNGYVTSVAYHPDGMSFWTSNERIGD
jgi:WD40 repeat protein